MEPKPLPFALPMLMVAAWLAILVAVKLLAAPWIVHEYGWAGVIVSVLACLAIGRWLES